MLPVYLILAAMFAATVTCKTVTPHPWPPVDMPRAQAFLEDVVEYPTGPAPVDAYRPECEADNG